MRRSPFTLAAVLTVTALLLAGVAAATVHPSTAAPAGKPETRREWAVVDVTPPGPVEPDYAVGVYLRAVEIDRYLAAVADHLEGVERAKRAQVRADRSRRSTSRPGGGGHRGYSSWHECTSMVENGGDYGRSTNRSHFGRYQFSRSTWASYGGNPATWGHATPEEQDAVFARAVASGGEGHWRPYNGC